VLIIIGYVLLVWVHTVSFWLYPQLNIIKLANTNILTLLVNTVSLYLKSHCYIILLT